MVRGLDRELDRRREQLLGLRIAIEREVAGIEQRVVELPVDQRERLMLDAVHVLEAGDEDGPEDFGLRGHGIAPDIANDCLNVKSQDWFTRRTALRTRPDHVRRRCGRHPIDPLTVRARRWAIIRASPSTCISRG